MNNIVFFEEINTSYIKIINKYLRNNYLIYFFDSDAKFSNHPKIKTYLEENKLIDASQIIYNYQLLKEAAFHANENVDDIFTNFYSSNQSIKYMKKNMGFLELEDMYKHKLLMDLDKIYEIPLKINEILKKYKYLSEIHYIPKNYKFLKYNCPLLIETEIKVMPHENFKTTLKNIRYKLCKTILLLYPLYIIIKKVKSVSNKKESKKFEIGITISHSKKMFFMNQCNEDFFINNNEMSKDDVLFIDENCKLNINDYEKRGG